MVFFAAIAAAVAVASPSPSASPTAPPEITHVTTSDRSDESITRAARITYVVTAAQIKQQGDRTIVDAIDSVPGVSIERYGGFAAGTSVSLRGSSQSQVLVMVDGLPVAGAMIGSLDLGALSTEGVDRIEVVEGGGSTLYGSQSIGGVINIITSNSAKYGGYADVGSFNSSSFGLDTPYLSFERTYSANDYLIPNGTTRQNADGSLTAGSLHYSHAIGAITATFFADASNQLLGVPGELGSFSPTAREGTVNNDARLSLAYDHARSHVTLDLGASRSVLSETCDTAIDPNCPNAYVSPPPTYYTGQYSEGRTMASVRNVVGDQSFRLIYGADVQRGVGTTNDGLGDPIQTDAFSQSALYVQSQWFAQNGNTLYAGLRGERDSANGAASPSLGGILHLSNDVEIKANASTAFRAPTLEELYYPNASNPNLVPEHTRNADATLVDQSLLGGTSLGWFTTAGRNLINFDLTTFEPANIQRALIQGFVFSTKTLPFNGITASLDLTNLYEANDLVANTRLDGRGPVFKSRLGLQYAAPNSSQFDGFGVYATIEGPRGYVNYAAPSYDQPAEFTRIDAFVSYRVTKQLLLTVRGNNLGNERYADFGSFNPGNAAFYLYPMPGRSFSVEVRTR